MPPIVNDYAGEYKLYVLDSMGIRHALRNITQGVRPTLLPVPQEELFLEVTAFVNALYEEVPPTALPDTTVYYRKVRSVALSACELTEKETEFIETHHPSFTLLADILEEYFHSPACSLENLKAGIPSKKGCYDLHAALASYMTDNLVFPPIRIRQNGVLSQYSDRHFFKYPYSKELQKWLRTQRANLGLFVYPEN